MPSRISEGTLLRVDTPTDAPASASSGTASIPARHLEGHRKVFAPAGDTVNLNHL